MKIRKEWETVQSYMPMVQKERPGFGLLRTCWDYLLARKNLGCSPTEYFVYRFYLKGNEERKTYVVAREKAAVIRACNRDEEARQHLANKGLFNQTFTDHLDRRWLVVRESSYEEFLRFNREVPDAFYKPLQGERGMGSGCTLNLPELMTEGCYQKMKDGDIILEGRVHQHSSLAAFNESTVNTTRVLTITDQQGEPHVIGVALRLGRAGSEVDNFHQGGIAVCVDPHTGTVISDGIDRKLNRYKEHPDSHLVFRGFTLPMWDQALEMCAKSAKRLPTVRYIGWDVAFTEERPILIEGNSLSDVDLIQMSSERGIREEYLRYV